MWVTNQHPFRYDWRTDTWFINPTTGLLVFNQVAHDMDWECYTYDDVIVKWTLQETSRLHPDNPNAGENYWTATRNDRLLLKHWGCTPPGPGVLDKAWKLATKDGK